MKLGIPPKGGSKTASGRADLHVHSTCSDGALAPADLVCLARQSGLAALAITDHDMVDGVPEALEAGERQGVQVVPGVEINTDVPGSEVHMLGYYVDPQSSALRQALECLREGRLQRAEQVVAKLRQNGVLVNMERVLEIAEQGSAVGRPHIARAVIEAGYASDIGEAFEKYLKEGRPGYVPRQRFSPEEAIALILEAGGAPVLAHPGTAKRDDWIPQWIRRGLVGIEAEHPSHRPEEALRYYAMARDLGVIATAGSDFHVAHPAENTFGRYTCGLDTVHRLYEAALRGRR